MEPSNYNEADAYKSPTRLFTLINNGESPISVIQHAFNFPQEVGTWIISRKNSKEEDQSPTNKTSNNSNDVVWKYLPIHLVCLQKNPNKELLLVMQDIFPEGLKMRDYQGNLPIHYLLLEGCEEEEILDIVADDDYSCLHEKDGEGRHMIDIILQSNASENCKKVMKRWFKKRDTNSSVLSPKKKSPAKSRNHHSSTITFDDDHNSFQNELLASQRGLTELFKNVEKLEWECDAKDQTIDSLSAQLMSLERKLSEKENINEQLEHASKLKNSGAQQKNSEDALQSMKEKMAIDASIVASQEDTINQLKSELLEAKQNNGKMQNQIGLFEAKILQHDEAVAHVRKVSNILQDDIKSKEKDVDDLKEKLDLTVKGNKELRQKLAAKELTSDRKLEGFQENIKQQSETLTDLLQKLKEKENENEQRISQEVNFLKDEIAVKDEKVLTLERKLKAVEAANAELLNDLADKDKELNKNVKNAVNRIEIQAVENKLEEALLRNSDLTNKLAEKEKEMNSKLQTLEQKIRLGSHSVDSYGSHSDDSTQNRNNSNAVIAAARNYLDRPNNVNEVKEKQSQLQSELRDIYAQIRAVMPGLEMPTRCQTIESGKPLIEDGMDEMKENSISGVSTQRQLWEDKRPWRMQANNENANEVFNTEGWGSRSQASGNSVYNI